MACLALYSKTHIQLILRSPLILYILHQVVCYLKENANSETIQLVHLQICTKEFSYHQNLQQLFYSFFFLLKIRSLLQGIKRFCPLVIVQQREFLHQVGGSVDVTQVRYVGIIISKFQRDVFTQPREIYNNSYNYTIKF